MEQQERSPYWGLVYQSERVAVAMSSPPSERVCLAVSSTVAGLQIDLTEWEHLCSGRMGLSHVRSADRSAVADVLAELQEVLPHASAVRARLDVGALEARERDLLKEREARERAETERLRDHQGRWKKARREGTPCPHCGERSEVRAVNRYPRGRSFFICRTCSRSFDGAKEE